MKVTSGSLPMAGQAATCKNRITQWSPSKEQPVSTVLRFCGNPRINEGVTRSPFIASTNCRGLSHEHRRLPNERSVAGGW
ncbi:hypothetical protein J6590_008815 [Homalodisca vitripennis]|nr:hypothetical protein J6590_008815 [Homalodisca vitripennis]